MTEETIEKYVRSLPAALFGLGTYNTLHCTKLEKGLHHLNFKMAIADGVHTREAVLRLPATTENRQSLMNEARYLEKLSSDIAPRVLYCTATSPFGPVMITEFVPGRHIAFHKLTAIQIVMLAKKLATLHSIKAAKYSPGNAALPSATGTYRDYALLTIHEGLDKPYGRAKGIPHDYVTVSRARELLRQQLNAADASWNQTEFSLCHGDISIYNVLWTKHDLRLIDWEDARFGDPADDVAYVFAINNVLSDWQNTFLDAYIRASARKDILARITTYLLKNYLFDVVWSLGKLLEEQESRSLVKLRPGEYRAMHEQRLKALKKYLSSL